MDGNLLNTPLDVLIDSIFLILTVCAYIPQFNRLRAARSTRGISPYFVLCSVFFSNVQLSQSLLCGAYVWPHPARALIKQIIDGNLRGLAALGGMLGHLQIFVQWLCSIAVLVSFANAELEVARPSAKTISVLAFLHVAATVFPAFAIALPRPDRHAWIKDITMALIGASNVLTAPCFVIVQLFAQIQEMRNQNGVPGALSLLSLFLQAPTVAALGFRWGLRNGQPTWGSGGASLFEKYQWSFPATNFVLHALTCALLLASYLLYAWNGSGEHTSLHERQALLP